MLQREKQCASKQPCPAWPTFVAQVAQHPSANRGDLRAMHVGQQALAHPDGQVDAHHLLGCHLSSADACKVWDLVQLREAKIDKWSSVMVPLDKEET